MNDLKIKGIYKHFKGDYYLVEDTAISSDDGKTIYVIYRKLYDFLDDVDKEKYPNVKQKKKFAYQEIKSVRKDFSN